MTIQIPLVYAPKFSEFFTNFDEHLEELDVQSYGISISTLEEVFLKIGHLEEPFVVNTNENKAPTDTNQESQSNVDTPRHSAEHNIYNYNSDSPFSVGAKDSDFFNRINNQSSEESLPDFNLKDNQKELD